MKGALHYYWLFVILSLAGFALGQQSYPLEQLTPGQKGYAVTAGPGNVLKSFDVEVLALQNDDGLGFPLVLIEVSGEFIEQFGGVAAGMSGSPVYLPLQGEDALLGAIGYTFPNSDFRLALVTPIEVMRRNQAFSTTKLSPFGLERWPRSEAVAVRTPLLFSGLSARASESLAELFSGGPTEPFPVQAGGVSSAFDNDYVLEPGSAISVQMVRGDITIAAVGTVTTVENDKILAFGHPLLGQGAVSFALAPAYISYIVANKVVPFKLANNGQRVLGNINQDRPYAVSGNLEQTPDFLPVALTINGPKGSETKRFELSNDERYYAPLLAAASLEALDENLEGRSGGSAELAWEISLSDGDTVRVLEQVYDPADIATAIARVAAAPLAILADNNFAKPEITRLNLNISYQDNLRYAEVVEVVAENDNLTAGDTLSLYVRLQPYRAEPVVKTIQIPLAEDISGELKLTIRGGFEPEAKGEDDNARKEPILSFAELLLSLEEQVQASELVVETFVDGKYRRLERLALPYPISGSELLSVTVSGIDNNPEPGEAPEKQTTAEQEDNNE